MLYHKNVDILPIYKIITHSLTMTSSSQTTTTNNNNNNNDGFPPSILSPPPQISDVDDVRIVHISPIPSPALLLEEFPSTEQIRRYVKHHRQDAERILNGKDDRLLVLVGPCSIHDVDACHEYAVKLSKIAIELNKQLKIVMRVYFEKPRTTIGWKGLINDPDLDGTNKIAKGLSIARRFLLKVNEMGLPAGVEFLDSIIPQYLADLVTWGAIGARTTESQVHRELASGLSCPIGFKNGTSGDVEIAVDACLSSAQPHSFLSVTKDGVVANVNTRGNEYCHIILRGGKDSTNYDAKSVSEAADAMRKRNLDPRIIIDCSHGNTMNNNVKPPKKEFKRQLDACLSIGDQVAGGDYTIKGVMIESFLDEGSQSLNPGKTDITKLKRGVSCTDPCVNFDDTVTCLRLLASQVEKRRDMMSRGKREKIGQ
jgi:3-deoxy-7-phosphoheptulonate synthase